MARSKFEATLKKKLKNCKYEPGVVGYTWEANYLPDFIPINDEGILIEAKGRFRDRNEARKYIAVAKSNPDKKLVFIFMNPKVPMPGARKRADGSRLSHAQWAEKHGFEWYTLRTLPEEWCNK